VEKFEAGSTPRGTAGVSPSQRFPFRFFFVYFWSFHSTLRWIHIPKILYLNKNKTKIKYYNKLYMKFRIYTPRSQILNLDGGKHNP
jgi:hypothetical protein